MRANETKPKRNENKTNLAVGSEKRANTLAEQSFEMKMLIGKLNKMVLTKNYNIIIYITVFRLMLVYVFCRGGCNAF